MVDGNLGNTYIYICCNIKIDSLNTSIMARLKSTLSCCSATDFPAYLYGTEEEEITYMSMVHGKRE